MPIVYPVIERISRELFRRLELMRTATTYQTKVKDVVRPTRTGNFTPSHLQIVMTKGDEERDDELTYPGNPPGVATRVTYRVHCHVMNDENSCTAIDQEVNQFVADVTKAITGTSPTWYTFDGNAMDATILPYIPIESDGSIDGATLPVSVLYRVKENDPYMVRS